MEKCNLQSIVLLPPALLIVEINPSMWEYDAERRRLIESVQHQIKMKAPVLFHIILSYCLSG